MVLLEAEGGTEKSYQRTILVPGHPAPEEGLQKTRVFSKDSEIGVAASRGHFMKEKPSLIWSQVMKDRTGKAQAKMSALHIEQIWGGGGGKKASGGTWLRALESSSAEPTAECSVSS